MINDDDEYIGGGDDDDTDSNILSHKNEEIGDAEMVVK